MPLDNFHSRPLASQPTYWRVRAAQLRALLWGGTTLETKANLLKLVSNYEKLAARTDGHLTRASEKSDRQT